MPDALRTDFVEQEWALGDAVQHKLVPSFTEQRTSRIWSDLSDRL